MNPYFNPAPPPGKRFHERLELTDHWLDMRGRSFPLVEMPTDYLWNVLLYLWDHRSEILTLERARRGPVKLPAPAGAAAWIAKRPIWVAIVTELIRRREIGTARQVGTRLTALSTAYRTELASLRASREYQERVQN